MFVYAVRGTQQCATAVGNSVVWWHARLQAYGSYRSANGNSKNWLPLPAVLFCFSHCSNITLWSCYEEAFHQVHCPFLCLLFLPLWVWSKTYHVFGCYLCSGHLILIYGSNWLMYTKFEALNNSKQIYRAAIHFLPLRSSAVPIDSALLLSQCCWWSRLCGWRRWSWSCWGTNGCCSGYGSLSLRSVAAFPP